MKNNFFKKVGKGFLALSILANTFMPITLVNADSNFTVTLTVADTTKLSLEKLGNGDITVTYSESINNKTSSTITSHIPQEDPGDLESLTCTASSCVYVVKSGKTIEFVFEDHDIELKQGETKISRDSNSFGANSNVDIIALESLPGTDPVQPGFDVHAYVLWGCKDHEGICMKHYTDIQGTGENSNFIKASTIVDERTNEVFDINNQYRAWSTDAKFDEWVRLYKMYKGIDSINWAEVDAKDMIGDPEDVRPYEKKYETVCNKPTDPMAPGNEWEAFERCVNEKAITEDHKFLARAQLQPVGEPQEKNAYVSYGDRNFKAVIYNDDYKGVSIGSLSDLHYYPTTWTNPFLRREQFDISGTTKDKPATIDAILLEDTINIKVLNYNGFSIETLEALDVSEKAVEVSKDGDEWKIKFNSNFYDHVVFKATDSNNKVSYFQVKRTTVDPWIRHGENNKPIIIADFYFDRTKSYSDYDLTAKIIYKDGSEKMVKLEAVKRIDDGMGNITEAYEVDEETPVDPDHNPEVHGKGLKHSVFEYELEEGEDQKIKTFYVYIENKGSTDKTYAGTVAGSGKGVKANLYDPEEDQ